MASSDTRAGFFGRLLKLGDSVTATHVALDHGIGVRIPVPQPTRIPSAGGGQVKIAVSGATGLIGSALCRHLIQHGHELILLVRNPTKAREQFPGLESIRWEMLAGPPPEKSLEDLDAVIHLSGEPIAAGRWTAERKRSIRESRITGTRHLVDAILRTKKPPRALLNGSAIGYYGSRGDEVLIESSPPGGDFLGETCERWEGEARRAQERGVRVVLLRTALVLSTGGGALPRMLPPFRLGLGGKLGSGKQWMSWIHIEDEVGAIRYLLEDDSADGPFNLSAPQPVTNLEFTKELARVLGRPAIFPVPGWVLRLLFGEMAESVLLSGQRVLPNRLEQSGFPFQFRRLPEALEQLLA